MDIFVASGLGDEDQVKSQLMHGARVNMRDGLDIHLCTGPARGHLVVVKLLILQGANVNAVNSQRFTPLILSLADLRTPPVSKWKNLAGDDERRKSVVRFLISHGANAGVVNKFGRSAADYANARGYNDIVELLRQPKV